MDPKKECRLNIRNMLFLYSSHLLHFIDFHLVINSSKAKMDSKDDGHGVRDGLGGTQSFKICTD